MTVAEQDLLVRHNELALKAFCTSFKPPMPLNVMVRTYYRITIVYIFKTVQILAVLIFSK